MAERANDVQVEHGHIRVANRLYEALLDGDFAPTQLKILHGVIRLTYGWRRRTVMISHPELARAINVSASGTFRGALRELIREGVVISLQRGHGHEKSVLAIQKDFTCWGRFSVSPTRLERVYGTRPESDDDLLTEWLKTGTPHAGSTQNGAGGVPESGHSDPPKVGTPTAAKSKSGKGSGRRKDMKDNDRQPTGESNWVALFGDDWVAAKKGTAPYARIGRVLKPLITQYGEAPVRLHWLRFVASEKSRFGPEYFANNYGDYLAETDVSSMDRARVLLALYKDHDLLTFSGSRAAYAESKRRAAADARAGETFERDFVATRPWEREVGALPEAFAMKEIARRLDAARSTATAEAKAS